MGKVKSHLDYGPNRVTTHCSIYTPPIKCDGIIVPSNFIEISTLDKTPAYYILPNIKTRYSLKIGIEVEVAVFSAWKLGVIEFSEILQPKNKWFKFIFPESLVLWKTAIKSHVSIIDIEDYKTPRKSYINKILKNAIRDE